MRGVIGRNYLAPSECVNTVGSNKIRNEILIPFLVTFLFSLIVTYPVWLRPNSTLIGDHPSDAMGTVVSLWLNRQIHKGILKPGDMAMTGAPFDRIPPPYFPPYHVGYYLQNLVSYIVGELAAYNFTVICSFLLTALIFPLLVREVFRFAFSDCAVPARQVAATGVLTYAATMGSLMFTLSPYHLAQAREHDKLASVQWLALVAWLWARWRNRPTLLNASLLFTSWVWCFLWDFQLGYFMAVFLVTVFTIDGLWSAMSWIRCASEGKKSVLFKARGVSVFALGVAIVAIWTLARVYPSINTTPAPLDQLYICSAGLRNYLAPPRSHPFLGRFGEDVLQRLITDAPVLDSVEAQYVRDLSLVRLGLETEVSIYLGWVCLLLAGVGIWVMRRRRKEDPQTFRLLTLFATAGIAGFLLSLPPTLGIVKMPSYYVHLWVPMFRVLARMGSLVMLCTSVLASAGVYFLAGRWGNHRLWKPAYVIAVLLVVFEYTDIPPVRYIEAKEPPGIYAFLARLPGNPILAEYPMVQPYEWKHTSYCFWQRVHSKPLFNGAMPPSEAHRVAEIARDLSNPETVTILGLLGIRYLVVHEAAYRVPVLPWLRGLSQVYRCGTDVVYQVPVISRNPLAAKLRAGTLTAEEVFACAARLTPGTARQKMHRGEVYAHKGFWQAAIAEFEQVVRMQPDNSDAALRLGTAYLYLRQPVAAARTLEAAARHSREPSSDICFLLASAYAQIPGHRHLAVRHFRRCLQLDSHHSARAQIEKYLRSAD